MRSPAAKDCTILDLGVDAYYKIATDLLDNGNFGQALVLSAFNYAQGIMKASNSAPNTTTAISRPTATWPWPSSERPIGVEPVSVRQPTPLPISAA